MVAEATTPVNPQNIKIIAYGIPVTEYRSQGQYCILRPAQDIANITVGTDGDQATVINLNNNAEMTLRVMKNTPTYRLLRAAAVAFQTTGLFLPSSVIDIADPTDTSFSLNSFIKSHSEDVFSSDSGDLFRTYVITCHNLIRI